MWHQHSWGQRASLCSNICPWECGRPCVFGLLHPFWFGCNPNTRPWRKTLHKTRCDQWWFKSLVRENRLWDTPSLFRSRKSTHIRICPFFFFTGTMLAIQSGFSSSRTNPASMSGFGYDFFFKFYPHSAWCLFHGFELWVYLEFVDRGLNPAFHDSSRQNNRCTLEGMKWVVLACHSAGMHWYRWAWGLLQFPDLFQPIHQFDFARLLLILSAHSWLWSHNLLILALLRPYGRIREGYLPT